VMVDSTVFMAVFQRREICCDTAGIHGIATAAIDRPFWSN
jgi:hypothetical protein